MAARSVGTFFNTSENVIPVDAADLKRGFRLMSDFPNSPGKTTLRYFASTMGGGDKYLDDYRFWDDQTIGESTAYHIGAGLVVTAEHVIRGATGLKPKKPDETLLIFGLTDEQYPKDSQAIVPAANVFILDK